MRCEEGDIALITSSIIPENNGKMVKCLEFVGKPPSTGIHHIWDGNDWWRVDRDCCISGCSGMSYEPYIRDRRLTPIRPEADELEETGEKEYETI